MTTIEHLKLGKALMYYLHGKSVQLYLYTDLKKLPMHFPASLKFSLN